MEKKRIAVLGAGNGGQALAAYLAYQGHQVNLYNRSLPRISALQETGQIKITGVVEGIGYLNIVTDQLVKAIEGVEIVLVVTPAVAHRYLASKLSSCLEDGQLIILNPGRTGGALEFNNILTKNNCQADLLLAEAQTFIFASRVVSPGEVKIFAIKNKVELAAFPSNKTKEVFAKLDDVLPQFFPVENVLKTSLDNIGAVFHPAPTLLNMAWIESRAGDFNYYQEGVSQSVAKVLEKIDEERMAVAQIIGVEPTSAAEWLRLSYGAIGHNLHELLNNNLKYAGIKAPPSTAHRYIFEDVPMSLVPIASLGDYFKVETPAIKMIIDLANLVHQTDYRATGRTVASLGIEGMSINELRALVTHGSLPRKTVKVQFDEHLIEGVEAEQIMIPKLLKKLDQESGVQKWKN